MKPQTRHLESVAVIGASIAGLLAAAAVAPYARRVVIVERDELPDLPSARPSTPQARHSHGLLVSGREAMEALLPGLTEQLVALGARADGDIGAAGRWWVGGGLFATTELGHHGMGLSRHLLEHQVRTRVRELPNVEIRPRNAVLGLVGDHKRVTGIMMHDRARGREPDVLEADLVLDASGRAGGTRRWLTALGVAAPVEDRITVGVRYVTTHVEARPDDADGASFIISAATPDTPRVGVALRQEDGTWSITLATYGETPLPLNHDGIEQVARTLVSPDLAGLLAGRPGLHQPWTYRYPDCMRRRFEAGTGLPLGYLPIGDAICSFDPTLGQGMSVAALQALQLRRHASDGLEKLRRGYVPAATAVADTAWQIILGAIIPLPGIQPTPIAKTNAIIGRYIRSVQRAGHRNPYAAAAFLRVTNLLAPPSSLMRPRVAWHVVRWACSGSSRKAQPHTQAVTMRSA